MPPVVHPSKRPSKHPSRNSSGDSWRKGTALQSIVAWLRPWMVVAIAVIPMTAAGAERTSHQEEGTTFDPVAEVTAIASGETTNAASAVTPESASDVGSDTASNAPDTDSSDIERGEGMGSETASSWLPELRPESSPRIQNRLFTKHNRLHMALGGEYLARGDFHVSPGVAAWVSWFFSENWAIEAGASHFFSYLNPIATDVRRASGFVPDSRAPQWLFRVGPRLSAGYGKVLILGQVVHFEPQFFARAALLISDGSLSPGGEFGAGVHVHLSRGFHLRFDLSVFPHAERRSRWRAVYGVAPMIAIGYGVP